MTGGLVVDAAVARGGFTVSAAFTAEPGRTVAVVGSNGAGKSTLLAAVTGLLAVERGVIRIGDRTLDDGGDTLVPPEERGIGVVFQDHLLFPHLDVLDNVGFATRLRDGRAAGRRSAQPWLARLGIADLAARRPGELSGGQRQRVALARALAAEPAALLLDEPLAALDVEVRDDVRVSLRATLSSFGGPSVLVTHDWADVVALAAEVVVLERGAVTQRGTPAQLVAAPATAYVRRLTRDPSLSG